MENQFHSKLSLCSIIQEYGDNVIQLKRSNPILFTTIDTSEPATNHQIDFNSNNGPSFPITKKIDVQKLEKNTKKHLFENLRHVVRGGGNGRFAFGPAEQLRDIYSLPHEVSHQGDQERIEFEEISLAKLSLNNGENENTTSHSANNVRTAEHLDSVAGNNKLPNKKSKSNPISTSTNNSIKPNEGKGSGTNKPSGISKPNNPANKPPVSSKPPVPGAPNYNSSTNAKTNKPPAAAIPPKVIPNPYVQVGGKPSMTAGRSAAMARMAALGEDWAEEEDLPGMSMPISSNVLRTGQVSSTVSKETNKSISRQQKLKVAKQQK